MGNRQQSYIIGASISAIAVVLAFASIVPTLQETPTASTALNALGHATVVVTDPEGNIMSYSQGDNFVLNQAVNNLRDQLFASKTGIDAKWLALCQGTAARTDTGCGTTEMAHARVDGDTGSGTGTTSVTGNSATQQAQKIMQVTFTIGSADSGKTFTELGLFTSGDTAATGFAVADITDITPALGASVGLTYTVNIGGG